MTNHIIREQQRANSKKLAEDRLPLIRQRSFPKDIKPSCISYNQHNEMERRKRQIECGQLKAENGLAV